MRRLLYTVLFILALQHGHTIFAYDEDVFIDSPSHENGILISSVYFLLNAIGKEGAVYLHNRYGSLEGYLLKRYGFFSGQDFWVPQIGFLQLMNAPIYGALVEGLIGGIRTGRYKNEGVGLTALFGISNVFIAYMQELLRQPVEWCVPAKVKNKMQSALGKIGYFVLRASSREVLRYILRSMLHSLILSIEERKTIVWKWPGVTPFQWDPHEAGITLLNLPFSLSGFTIETQNSIINYRGNNPY